MEKFDPIEVGARPNTDKVAGIDDRAERVINWVTPDPMTNTTNQTEVTERTANYDPLWEE